jgi:16S rRNA (cytidine1402-2'-O)-methyltransferase
VLREVSIIAAEDTRRTARLLAHHDIKTPTLSFHEYNERDRAGMLLEKLRGGLAVALVADAGTPLISDPGAGLVQAARAEGIRVEVVPGASALLTAVVAADLPVDSFTFLGFAPARATDRERWLRALAAEPRTTVFFEAPHRIVLTLRACARILPDRQVAVARELTKLHEELLVGTAEEVLSRLDEIRGEFTVVVGPPPAVPSTEGAAPSDDELWCEFSALTAEVGTSRRNAVATLARRYGVPARDIYTALERAKGER